MTSYSYQPTDADVVNATSAADYGTLLASPSGGGGDYSTPSPSAKPPATFTCDNVTLFNEYFTYCSREFEAISSIKLYSLPLFVVVGSVGNAACLAALSQKSAAKTSTSFYMAALTVVHTAVLYMGCGLEWYSFVTRQIHFLHTVDWFCRFFNFSFSVIRCAAWWLLVAMAADCHLELRCPARARSVCTPFVAKFVTTSIFVWLVSLHVHAMWIYEVRNGVCVLDAGRRDFETVVWPWITAIFSHYLPIALVAAFLVLLVVGVGGGGALADGGRCHGHPGSRRRFAWLTATMATIFLATTLPTIIMNFIDQSRPLWQVSDDPRHWRRHSQYILWQVVFSTLESFYVSFCFLLFFAAFPALRAELRTLLRNACCCHRPRARDQLANSTANEQLVELNNVKRTDTAQNNRTTLV